MTYLPTGLPTYQVHCARWASGTRWDQWNQAGPGGTSRDQMDPYVPKMYDAQNYVAQN